MTDTATPGSAPTGELYFFLIRLQWSMGGGLAATVLHGTYPVLSGQSRHQVFTELRDMAIEHTGAPNNAEITMFALEPDRIA